MVNQSVWGYFPWWIYLWSVEVISCAQPFMVYKYISMVSGSSFPQSNQLAYPPTNITMENIHVNRWYRHRCSIAVRNSGRGRAIFSPPILRWSPGARPWLPGSPSPGSLVAEGHRRAKAVTLRRSNTWQLRAIGSGAWALPLWTICARQLGFV